MDWLCDFDGKEKGYILEAAENPAQLFEGFAKLLAHPLQRCPQRRAFYELTDDNAIV